MSSPFHGADGRDHVQTLAVSRDGTWALFLDGPQPSRTGTLTLVSWPDNSLAVQFRLADDIPVITIRAPFTSFTANGLVFTAQ